VPGGQGSAALFDGLQIGQRIELDGPYGMAWLRRHAPRDILCLAGGSGLAPMISIARAAMVEPQLAERQLHFVYGGRTPADLCGEDLLRALPGWGQRLHYHAFVSMPPPDWCGASGFVHQAAAGLFGERLRTMEIYFAGPPAMATAVQGMLLEAQVPPAQMHFDAFY
jgi:toluene monooxygenase electron transfer component